MPKFGRICLLFLGFMLFFSGHPPQFLPKKTEQGGCNPLGTELNGYSFVLPDAVNSKSAFAPFFLHFRGAYRAYFDYDIQKSENIREWNERFCDMCDTKDIEDVVYGSLTQNLNSLMAAASDPTQKTPYDMKGNSFADALVDMGCTEVIEYLYYAKECEPVALGTDAWRKKPDHAKTIKELIRKGLNQHRQTKSQYVRLRYAFQIIRLAHYGGYYEQVLELFDLLTLQTDIRKESILLYWMMGHKAAALQKLGRNAEAAYLYSYVFRNCPSKRVQAYRSFKLSNQQEWETARKYCKNDKERASLLLLRIAADPHKRATDIAEVYRLEPKNPMLEAVVMGEIQELEWALLRTKYTNLRLKSPPTDVQIRAAQKHLKDLRTLAHRIAREEKAENPLIWMAIEGYLASLDGDYYRSDAILGKLQKTLNPWRTKEKVLIKQVDVWFLVNKIRMILPKTRELENAAYTLREYPAWDDAADFDFYFRDYLAAGYDHLGQAGKAIAMAFDSRILVYNPDIKAIDDMVNLANQSYQSRADVDIASDSVQQSVLNGLYQLKAAQYLARGELEATKLILDQVRSTFAFPDSKFTPFHEEIRDCTFCLIPKEASPKMTRPELVEELMRLKGMARADDAMGGYESARYYYRIGLAYYNISYFGQSWQMTDWFRSGSSWANLSNGPVFEHPISAIGNRENTELSHALEYFDLALRKSKNNPELHARAAFMAARVRQKQWFCSKTCDYRPGRQDIPTLPAEYDEYTRYFLENCKETRFYGKVIGECTWMGAYSRR